MIGVELDLIAERQLHALNEWHQQEREDAQRDFYRRLHDLAVERHHGIERILDQFEKRINPQSILTKWGYLFV